MDVTTLALATFIVALGTAQYILVAQAIRDLIRRPRVRGGNKVSWGLLILCVPIAGALLYSWMGPTSLLRPGLRPAEPRVQQDPLERYANELRGPRPSNVTPLYPRTEPAIRGRTPARRQGLTRSRAHNTRGTVTTIRRTGS
jgi:hypothetical protein